MNRLLDSSYSSINEKTTTLEFYKMMKFIISAIHDGHLYCSPPPDVKKYYEDTALFCPIKMQFIQNQAFAVWSPGNVLIPGTQIISINGVPVNTIKKQLFRYMVSDGYNETRKYYIINRNFRFYYYLVFGEKPAFEFTYRTETGLIEKRELKSLKNDQIPVDPDTIGPNKLLTLKYLNGIAILTVRTFDNSVLAESKENFTTFLKSAFEEMQQKNCKHLIIDLRDNGGGKDNYASLLFSYIAEKPFRFIDRLVVATKNLPYEELKSSVSSFNNLNPSMMDSIGPNRYYLKEYAHPGLGIYYPAQNNFKGKLLVIMNGMTFSSAAEFCTLVKASNRGQFIGEETGGAYGGNTSGAMFNIILPHSKMNISYGAIRYELHTGIKGHKARGVMPDYPSETFTWKTGNRDENLELALKLASGR